MPSARCGDRRDVSGLREKILTSRVPRNTVRFMHLASSPPMMRTHGTSRRR